MEVCRRPVYAAVVDATCWNYNYMCHQLKRLGGGRPGTERGAFDISLEFAPLLCVGPKGVVPTQQIPGSQADIQKDTLGHLCIFNSAMMRLYPARCDAGHPSRALNPKATNSRMLFGKA